ncbi:MAG: TonB-dependent receptor [Polyangiales bacterium]
MEEPPAAAPPTEGAAQPAAPEPTAPEPLASEDEAESGEELGKITITATRENRVEMGPLGTRSILETPFSVGQADAEQITRVAATTIDGALGYDSSIRSNNSGVASGNTFNIRGLPVDRTNGYKFDGLAFPYWFQDHPIEALEEIQVLKGAGGFLYGYASPSGIVNFISKKPTRELQVRTNLSVRSSNLWRAHLDVGGPLREGSTVGFRVNAVHEEGTLYNGAENKNDFVTLWLQGQIAKNLTWSADTIYQRTWQARQSNSISLGPMVTSLKPVSGKLNLGSASTTKWNDLLQITGRLNYQITPTWHATAAYRRSVLDERFPGNTIQITNNAGNYQSGILNQNRLFFYNVFQASVDGTFHTGPIEHQVVGGFDYLGVDFDYDYQPYTARGLPTTSFNFGLNGNLYEGGAVPDWGNNPSALAFQRPPQWYRYQEIRQRALFLSDTLKWRDAELLLGLRYTNYKETNDEPVQADTRYTEGAVTPAVALSYNLAEGARAYASYVQALERGLQAPSNAVNFGDTFGPLRSQQYEAGVKVQRGVWNATVAGFRTQVPSEFLTMPAAGEMLGRWVRNGQRRFQGLELDAKFEPTRELLVSVSTALLDAKQTKAADPKLVGKKVPGTTGFQASAFLQYAPDAIPGLRLFGGVRHSGRSYGQATNTFVFKEITTGDVGAGYTTPVDRGEVQLTANLSNITDERYWIPNATGTGLSPGAPRTFSVSLGWSPTTASASGGYGSSVPEQAFELDRDHWYLGLTAGIVKLADTTYDAQALVNPSQGRANDALTASHDVGSEVSGVVGYDWGLLRSELELTNTYAHLGAVDLRANSVTVDASNPALGTYDDPSGTSHLFEVMFNALIDIGGNARTPWAVQAGGGVGLVRVYSWKWRLEDSESPAFQVDNPTPFAWNAQAGIRRRLTDRVDLTLKYRFFNIPNQKLFTSNANRLEGSPSSHSALLGVNVNF